MENNGRTEESAQNPYGNKKGTLERQITRICTTVSIPTMNQVLADTWCIHTVKKAIVAGRCYYKLPTSPGSPAWRLPASHRHRYHEGRA